MLPSNGLCDSSELQVDMVQLPDGVELTVSELQEMAARQQQQIESQQQMLVAKEQRVKYLKQQEQRNHHLSTENERLQRLRERVETQEMKLQKLRALRGQVDQQKINNSNLTSELESIRSLFNSKEKELSLAVAKVEQLTKQLEELRKGRINGVNGGEGQTVNTAAAIELDKLRRELLYRNKLNEQQSNKLAHQREMLNQKSEEMVIIDKRIAELQQRLHRKRLLNQQLTNQINAAKKSQLRVNHKNNNNNHRVRPFSANVAAVEPYQHTPIDDAHLIDTSNEGGGGGGVTGILIDQQLDQRALDDLHTKLNSINGDVEELSEFQSNKNDPKYQTLPYNTKFTTKYGSNKSNEHDEQLSSNNNNGGDGKDTSEDAQSVGSQNSPNGHSSSSPSSSSSSWAPQTVHSIPTYTPPKAHATAVSKSKKQSSSNSNFDNSGGVVPLKTVQPHLVGTATQRLLYSSAYPGRVGSSTSSSATPVDINAGNNVNSVPVSGNSGNSYVSNQVPIGKVNTLAAPPYIPPPTTNITLKLQNASGNNTEKSSGVLQPQTSSSNILQVKGPSHQLVSSSRVNASRPSNIYQTSSTRILPVTPHTLGTTAQGILCEVAEAEKQEHNRTQTVNETNNQRSNSNAVKSSSESTVPTTTTTTTSAASDFLPGVPKPSLPPKPCVLQKPLLPPRQLIHGSSERISQLQDQTPENESNQSHDSKTAFISKANHLDQHSESSDAKSEIAESSAVPNKESHESSSGSPQKKQIPSKLPIKPKPLTIKKQTGLEPPKLRSNGSSLSTSSLSSSKKMSDSLGISVTINNLWSNSNNASVSNTRKSDNSDSRTHPDSHSVTNSGGGGGGGADVLDLCNGPSALEAYMDHGSYEKIGINNYQSITTRIGHPLDREKRKPFIESNDHFLDSNSEVYQNTMNEQQGANEISDGSPHHRLDLQFRPGPVGATVEENNNNYEEGGYHNKSKAVDMCNEDDVDKESSSSSSNDNSGGGVSRRLKKGNLKTHNSVKITRRVSFDPLALLLDAALEGELELVKKTTLEVPNPSAANDEGITALHNAICAGHYEIVKFLVEFGCDVNAQDSDGWTPLHCAASCNNLPMVKFLVEHGACIFATTLSDHETAAEKCEEDEEGFDGCTEYLYSIQEKLGILNNGLVYALYDYQAHNTDELDFKNGDVITVLRKGDEFEREWWWSKVRDQEGYIPRNLLGLFPRVTPMER